MIEIADRDVDESYRRGLADLVAHAPRPSTRTNERRVPRVAAIAAISIPVAALVVSAFIVIVAHGQRSVTPTAPATSGPGSTGIAIGKTVRVGPGHGLVANVTVQIVSFTGNSIFLPPLPKNYFNAGVTVQISTAATIKTNPAQTAYDQAALEFALTWQQFQTAKQNHDTARAAGLNAVLVQAQTEMDKVGLQLLPFNFQYLTANGHVYPAGGASGGSLSYSNTSPPKVLSTFNGVGSFFMFFQVPSRGGEIRMTDSFGQVIGQWHVPTAWLTAPG
jgi:hypothetical protein